MRYLRFALLGLLALAALVVPGLVPVAYAAVTFTVNSTADPGDGVCDTTECTLREAIDAANANPGTDTIAFNIPGVGPHAIQPMSILPTITGPVIIDGYTQPGASPNTNPSGLGSNAVLNIELEGTNAGSHGNGLHITAGSSTVRGLVVNRFEACFFGGSGIRLEGNGGNVVEGNFIGTDVTGKSDLGNCMGVYVAWSPDNTIGGSTPAARNVISGNGIGVDVYEGRAYTGNLVQGNFIGTDVTGAAAVGNGLGVSIKYASNNTIGGATPAARNVIAGNEIGLFIESDANANLVQGNYIGTDVTGSAALGNSSDGVVLFSSAASNTVGGTAVGAGNVISGNSRYGLRIDGDFTSGNVVQGNLIGTDATGTEALGNGAHGVEFFNRTRDNTIGGTVAGAGNIIAHNGSDGVSVSSGFRNAILSNSIFSNTGLGIDLSPDGVNPNNFPVLTSATSGSTVIDGTLDSTPNTEFRLEFFSNAACDPSGHGEGETFLGSTDVTTDTNGDVSFTVTFQDTVSVGQFITATATDPDNNTSEFSQCAQVLPPPVTAVTIDIKPGSDPNSTNLGSRGVIPVAILTTPDFDAASVDPATVDFEGASALHDGLEDVDGDGNPDLILHFRTQDAEIADDATEACLTGQTLAGQDIQGCDIIRIVPPWLDSDGDGFGDAVEATVTTDQFAACPTSPGHDAWPPDFNDDQVVNLLDLNKMLPPPLGSWGATPGDPAYSVRRDLVPDGVINLPDLNKVLPAPLGVWGQTCTP